MGQPVSVEPIPDDVHDLKVAVKNEYPNRLGHCDALELVVYPPGTEPADFKPENACRPDIKPSRDADYENPLFVVAPPSSAKDGENNLTAVFFQHLHLYRNYAPLTINPRLETMHQPPLKRKPWMICSLNKSFKLHVLHQRVRIPSCLDGRKQKTRSFNTSSVAMRSGSLQTQQIMSVTLVMTKSVKNSPCSVYLE